jgi:hypothetical protein
VSSSLSSDLLQRDGSIEYGSRGTGELYRSVREKYEEYLRITHEDLGLASSEQTQQLREWLNSIDPGDREKLHEAESWYREDYQKRLAAALELYHSEFLQPLRDARKEGVVSQQSFEEWVQWVRSAERSYKEKEASIRTVLPGYLEERRELARERMALLQDPRLEDVNDPSLKGKIKSLRDDREYFEVLSFSERRNLIHAISSVLAALRGGPETEQLYRKAEEMLRRATEPPQPALHRDKVGTWLKRIFESGASVEEIRSFLEGSSSSSLPALIKVWREVAIQFWTLRADPVFAGVKKEFINTKALLALHYDDRVTYVTEMRKQVERARRLRATVEQLVAQASSAGALDAQGRKRWLHAYVFNGGFTLGELESIVSGNLAVRLDHKIVLAQRFDRASAQARKFQGLRGMSVPGKAAFLTLHYDRQVATVLEMEKRLEALEKNKPDFLLIRHFMDRGDWDEALELIGEARHRGPLSFEDDGQLLSMERYIVLHRKERMPRRAVGTEIDPTLPESLQIDLLIDGGMPALQPLYIELCERSSKSIGALGWTMYNRQWCHKHGYLTPEREIQAIHTGQLQALQKVRRKKPRGVVSETIQGKTADEEFIELSRSGATNVCVDILDAEARVALCEKLHRCRDDHRALYWTNTIFHRGGIPILLEQQIEETARVYRIRQLRRKLEQRNQSYQYRGSSPLERQRKAA